MRKRLPMYGCCSSRAIRKELLIIFISKQSNARSKRLWPSRHTARKSTSTIYLLLRPMIYAQALLSESYDIVDFSGHADADFLVFATADNQPSEIPTSAVGELIARYASVKCVVLNACEAVKSLTVPISSRTIGMEESIPDKAAIEFSRGFYDALGAGKSIDIAYSEGVSAMKLASYDAGYVRMLKA